MRIVALIVAILDVVAWAFIAVSLFGSQSDAATKGLDTAAAYASTLLFALTAVPALVLVWRRRAPRLALGLALGFPAAIVVLVVAVVLTLP